MRSSRFVLLILLVVASSLWAQDGKPADSATAASPQSIPQVVDHFLASEAQFAERMRGYHPVVETYLQRTQPDAELGSVPISDQYFLARLDLSKGFEERFYVVTNQGGFMHTLLSPFRQMNDLEFSSAGFSSTIFVDRTRFDREHYWFKFLRREFLGNVRTMVFEVVPKPKKGKGLFLGRIWVEDQGYNIVRFNGAYTQAPSWSYYFHMDSWRENMRPGLWLPSHVYSEESDLRYSRFVGKGTLRYKAQTRFWGYQLRSAGRQQEFTDLRVETANLKDTTTSTDANSPLSSLRAWQREAEGNVIDRLEQSGILAPAGDVDKVLETVVNNIEITNNLDLQPEVRCRVMLTTPLESFTIGRTIVVSRGLLDVLPDEASLAAILAHELAHIALDHPIETKYAFADRMWVADEDSFDDFRFRRDEKQETAADAKALELLQKSPYKDKMASIGLFLRALQARAPALPNLLKARMGNGLVQDNRVVRMPQLLSSAPDLQMRKLEQVPALPLNSRIKLHGWDDDVEFLKVAAVPLSSAREKMIFEVGPLVPNLKRAPSAIPNASSVQEAKQPAK